MKAEAAPQNGDEMDINRPNGRFSNRAFRLQASTPPAIEHLSVASPDSCTESAAEPSSPEQAMIPQQAMMKDTLSPHTPSPLPADADATVTGTDIVYLADLHGDPARLVILRRAVSASSMSSPDSALRDLPNALSTRQDAQINYLSTLSIFMKQTTYLATLPKRSGELLNSTMVSINAPTHIGQATAMPGDVMLGRKGGVLFIPPQLAKSSESTHLRDAFGHQRLEEKKYTVGQIDARWTDAIEQDYRSWLKQNEDHLSVAKEPIEEILKEHQ
jgi:hypothetical protein